MSSTENKRALVWLGVAIVFFLAVLWWKRDSLFGEDQPNPDIHDKSTANGTEGGTANGTEGGTEGGTARNKPQDRFKPIRSEDPNAPKFAVKVIDDTTGKPIDGARVALFTVQAKVLADERTDATGTVEARPTAGNIHATAAWHKDYAIAATVAKNGPVEIRLTPVQFANINVGNVGPAQREWHKTSNAGVTFKFARTFNPAIARRDYFEFKMYEHVGLREHQWPVISNPIRIPRYLAGIKARLRFHSSPSLPNHLDPHGLRDQNPPSVAAIKSESKPIEAAADAQSFDVVSPPHSPHALIAHYKRPPGQDGVLFLNVSHLDRDENSPQFGSLMSASLNLSTYEESDGNVTFKVYDLPDTVVSLKLMHFPKGQPREIISCNPVTIDGLTEATLSIYQAASLTVKLTGQRADGEKASIAFLDDRFESTIGLNQIIPAEQSGRWAKIKPTTHRFAVRDSKFASGLHQMTLKPGEDRELSVEMKPGCKVTLVVDDRVPADAIIIHDKTTGNTRTYMQMFWQRSFTMKSMKDGKLHIMSLGHSLFLAQGPYEFGVKRGTVIKKTTVVLDAATKLIRLD